MDSKIDMTLFVKRYKEVMQDHEKSRSKIRGILERAKTYPGGLEEFAKLTGTNLEDMLDELNGTDYV